MAEQHQPADGPEEAGPLAEVPADMPVDASIRQRLGHGLNEFVHRSADWLIKAGDKHPELRKIGMKGYDLATRLIPKGRNLKRLGSVGLNVYRGEQPGRRGFRLLRELGVETVINLRPESDWERPVVAALGLRYIYLPLPPLNAPTHDLTLEFLHAVTDPAHGVVFFHCYHGVDRTGAMAACLRIARDGWTLEQAMAEMREYGFHEHGQRAKSAYVAEFAGHWGRLPVSDQCRVLHRPEPEAPVEAPPTGWWARARAWLGRFLTPRGQTAEDQAPPKA